MRIAHIAYPRRCSCCKCTGHYLIVGKCRFCRKGHWEPYAVIALVLFAALVITWMLTLA